MRHRHQQIVDQPPILPAPGHRVHQPQDRPGMLSHQHPPAVGQRPQSATLQIEADRPVQEA